MFSPRNELNAKHLGLTSTGTGAASVLLCALLVSACDRRFDFDVHELAASESGGAVPTPVPTSATAAPPAVSTTVPTPSVTTGAATSSPTSAAPTSPPASPTTNAPSTVPPDSGAPPLPTTPATEPDASMPSSCTDDADCGQPDLHCELLTGLCFECVVDADCNDSTRPWCDRALHRCVQCAVDQNCAETQVCDSVVRRCLQQCSDLSDCPPGSHQCDPRRQVCVNCDNDRECPTEELPFCGIGQTECVECRSDDHCDAPSLCDTLEGVCVLCRDSQDCSPEQVCDPVTQSCVD